jgi:hypothetical protein
MTTTTATPTATPSAQDIARKLQHALVLAGLHVTEGKSEQAKDLRLALKLITECLTPAQVDQARATLKAMKAPKAPTVTPVTITHVPMQTGRAPQAPPRLAAAPPAPKPTSLESAISSFPPVFGFRHFADSIRFRISPSESLVTPEGKILLAVHRLAKGSTTESALFGKVSPEGLRSQVAAWAATKTGEISYDQRDKL